MMMPANYSVIAENEMTYVVGGGIADYLAPVMTADNWKTLNTNVIKLIGNAFASSFVSATLGVLFSGEYTIGAVTSGILTSLSNIAHNGDPIYETIGSGKKSETVQVGQELTANGVLNAALQVVGGLAAIYTLGTGALTLNGGYYAEGLGQL